MTDRTSIPARTRKVHRAAGSRKAVAALSAVATGGLMFAMTTAEPAWTSQAAAESAPNSPEPVVVASASRSRVLLPVPPAGDGSLVTPTVAPATPQPIQLDAVAAPARVVTKTVVVQRGGSSTASSSTPATSSASATTKSSGSR